MRYRICIVGRLDQSWADWLGREATFQEQARTGGVITTLYAEFVDQPALFGALDRIRDLNLPLLSVVALEAPP